MSWALGVSVVLNILLLVAIVVLVIAIFEEKSSSRIYLEQWRRWEEKAHKAQYLVEEETDKRLVMGGWDVEMHIKEKSQ